MNAEGDAPSYGLAGIRSRHNCGVRPDSIGQLLCQAGSHRCRSFWRRLSRWSVLVQAEFAATFVLRWPPAGPLDIKKAPGTRPGASLNREASRLGDVGAVRGWTVPGSGPGGGRIIPDCYPEIPSQCCNATSLRVNIGTVTSVCHPQRNTSAM